jgi:hypothetical protein
MSTPPPRKPPQRPEKSSPDEVRGSDLRDAPAESGDEEHPDFSAEFDHPSGRPA